MEYFEVLLNRPASHDPTDIPPANDDLRVDCDPLTNKEIYQAIKQLKNGKSAGPDSIPAEALKADIETSVELNVPPLQDDLGRRTSPIRMEGRLSQQAAKEG